MNLKDIYESYFSEQKLNQAHVDKVRKTLNNGTIDWEERAVEASKSIIAAVCFKESAISLSEKTDNLIYPPIGFYYSMFHLSLGLLKLNYSVDLADLERIHHSRLFKIFESKFVTTNIISSNYIQYFKSLKELREYCNYQFGFASDLNHELEIANKITDKCFDEGFTFIHQILRTTDCHFRFKTSIGDSFGDDIISTYLSGEESDRIWDVLVLNSLTT